MSRRRRVDCAAARRPARRGRYSSTPGGIRGLPRDVLTAVHRDGHAGHAPGVRQVEHRLGDFVGTGPAPKRHQLGLPGEGLGVLPRARQGRARCHAVDANVRRQGLGKRRRSRVQCALGERVGEEARRRPKYPLVDNVDDRRIVAAARLRREGLRQKQRRPQIDVELAFDPLALKGAECVGFELARVIDEQRQRTQCGGCRTDQRRRRRVVGEIGDHHSGTAARRFDFGAQRIGLRAGAMGVDRNRVARLRQATYDRRADTARAAGHQRNAICWL